MKNSVLAILIRTLVVLNVLDFLGTTVLVGHRFTTEENPLMDLAIQRGPVIFAIAKGLLTIFSAVLLWISRKSKWAIPATLALIVVMAVVVFMQLVMVMQLVWR
jgi:hypothetical protein